MNCEHRGNKRAAPEFRSHLLQQNKKQDYGNTVQQHIHQVMRAGIHTEQLAIEHMGHGGKRMPVLRMHVGERPDNAVPIQTGEHVHVVCDVERIVVVDELMMKRLSKHGPRQRDQSGADGEL